MSSRETIPAAGFVGDEYGKKLIKHERLAISGQ
jgi:hypothetical protein